MICASEVWGILPYAEADLDEDDDPAGLPGALLGLVDRGWVQVHRLEAGASPAGQRATAYGPPIPRSELPAVLRDPATWDDPADGNWIGAVTLSATDAWRDIAPRS